MRRTAPNSRQIDLLTHWGAAGDVQITVLEYKTRYDVSKPTAHRDLTDLYERGLVGRRGGGLQRSYYSLYQQPTPRPTINEEDEQL